MWSNIACALIAFGSLAPRVTARGLKASWDTTLEPRQQPGVIATDQFLRRAFHQAFVVDDYLYVDGGQFSYTNNGTPVFQYATATLSLDLSKDWTNSTAVFSTTPKAPGVPNLNLGSMWYHESEKTIYANFVGSSSSTDPDSHLKPPALSLWSFKPDGSGSGTWSNVVKGGASAWTHLVRPSGPLSASGKNIALSLGGQDFNGASLPGLVQFDMNKKTFINSSSTDIGSKVPYRGSMQYVPVFGDQGIFIALGGTFNGSESMMDFGLLRVFDPVAQEWYNQTTTGIKPVSRVAHCVTGVASTDKSYEIFVYAGTNTHLGTDAVPFDTINILTLPGFHWITTPYNPSNPIHGHSCHSVGGSQVLVVGGADSNPKVVVGDLDKIAASAMESPDPNKQGLSVFDLTNLIWQDHYSASPAPYEQSDPIKEFYAQSGGNSTNLTPDIAALMQNAHFDIATTPNTTTNSTTKDATSPPPSSSNTGAIAGGVVGGVVALAVIAGLIWFCLRRKRRAAHTYSSTQTKSAEDMYKMGHFRAPEEGQDGLYRDGRWIAEVHHDSIAPAEADSRIVDGRNQPTAELP